MPDPKTVAKIKAIDAMKNVTMQVEIVGMRSYRIRTWIAKRLIALAVAFLGCRVRFDEVDAD